MHDWGFAIHDIYHLPGNIGPFVDSNITDQSLQDLVRQTPHLLDLIGVYREIYLTMVLHQTAIDAESSLDFHHLYVTGIPQDLAAITEQAPILHGNIRGLPIMQAEYNQLVESGGDIHRRILLLRCLLYDILMVIIHIAPQGLTFNFYHPHIDGLL